MTTKSNGNFIKGLMYSTMVVLVAVQSFMVNAQSSRSAMDESIMRKVKAWEDSVRKLQTRKYPHYFGGSLSLSVLQFDLKSNLPQLKGMHVTALGTSIGVVASNPVGKLRSSFGIYYSDPSVPYTIDMIQANVGANIYLLRLQKAKYHTFEPYATINLNYQQAKFYGQNLTQSDPASSTTNYSTGIAPFAGKTNYVNVFVGTGLEYQLEGDRSFIHFFTEITYGAPFAANASNESFNGTKAINSTRITVGINFGIVK